MTRIDLRIGATRGARTTFRLDDRQIEAFEGESIATALWAAGIRVLGANGREAQPPARTLFCAMGICQQCAVWIGGRHVEACRTAVRAGLYVRTAFDLGAVIACTEPATTGDFDLVVLGAGPAGAAAAIEASTLGLEVVVLDENAAAGGQVYRSAPGIAAPGPDVESIEGDALRRELSAASVDVRCNVRVWNVERVDGSWRVHALGLHGKLTLNTAALIVANGALERHVPFAGWQLPGVMGLAAATVLLKAQRTLPGGSVVVAGVGPLLLAVAKGIVEAGGRVAAIVDASPRNAWFADPLALLSRPDLVARGASWLQTLRKHRVRWLHGHIVQSVAENGTTLRASIIPVSRDGSPRLAGKPVEVDCDTVCCGYGLHPASEVTRLAGATHAYDSRRGGWHAIVDADQRCERPRLYAAGDCAGIVGAAAAPWQGRIAALAAALDLGRVDASAHRLRSASAKRARGRAARFGAAMTRLADIGNGAIDAIGPPVTMCLCEGVTRSTIDAAIDDGCTTLNDLRTATRCGMGPCGGRLCEDAVARVVALRTGRSRSAVGQPTGRPPLRPVDLDTLAGTFDYDALPIAAPSPL